VELAVCILGILATCGLWDLGEHLARRRRVRKAMRRLAEIQ
jgi:hypothetical protein